MKDLHGFTTFWEFGLAALSMALIFIVPISVSNATAFSSKPRVGGACEYKHYKGEAQITSVKQRQDNQATYDVRFSFHPQESIQEAFAKTENKQWSMVQDDFSSLQQNFLTKNGIKTGKRYPCIMKVITKGTCTPVLFEFPTIDKGRGVQ